MERRLLFILIFSTLWLSFSVAQTDKTMVIRQVIESLIGQADQINGGQKKVEQNLRKLSRSYDSAHFKNLLQELVDLNQLAPVNTVASPGELFQLRQRFDLSKSEIKQIERLEYQLTSAKDEWHHYAQHGEELKPYLDRVKSDTLLQDQLDKQIEALVTEHLIEQNELPQLESINSLKDQYFQDIDQFSTVGSFDIGSIPDVFNYSEEDLKRLANGELQKPFQGKAHLLREGHNKMSRIKEKLSSFADMDEEQVSRNSMHKYSFRQRIQLGGTFQFKPVAKGLKIDLNPTVSYWLNKQWILGLGGNYRINFGDERLLDGPNQVNGVRAFVDRMLFNNTFFHIEWEYLSSEFRSNESLHTQKDQSGGFLIGLGKTLPLARGINITAHTLYRLNHTQSTVYSSPWVFRIGFTTSRTE